MIKDNNVICISSIDWDFLWQGHQELMSLLAKEGNRVLFIENTGVRMPNLKDLPRIRKRILNWFKGVAGIRQETDNLFVFSPIVLPFPYFRIGRYFNKKLLLRILNRWIKIMDFGDPIVWIFLPTGLSLDIINNIEKKLVIYYCIDSFFHSSKEARKIIRTETKLIKEADLVFVTSKALYDYCYTYNHNVHIFPFGVNFERFQEYMNSSAAKEFKGLAEINKPIIGYIGGLHKWVDMELLEYAVSRLTDYSFVFAGSVFVDNSRLKKYKNVHFLGQVEHATLPKYLFKFDACIIPYLQKEYTKNVYPTKLNEYLSMGKPVISTDIPETKRFNEENNNILYISKDKKDFVECLKKSLEQDSPKLRTERINVARSNSWDVRIEKMCNLILDEIETRKLDINKIWKENLRQFYRTVRRRLLRFALALLLLYFFIFKTDIVWFLAKPLKIDSPLTKADAIVVFAGGVGESGKAGQGYEERVAEAIDLYKNSYSKNLIFSSGSRYAFNETEVMKALAISLGIPSSTIFIEDKSRNTFENVEFTKKILHLHRWNSILLVSSPYHMRRVSLVFKKNAPDIKVNFIPIRQSIFYSHVKGIKLYQIKSIIHEYIGIIYYWWKGRI